MRSIVYRFPDLHGFDAMVRSVGELELELGVPAGETVDDGEWVLAIFELGPSRRATSAAARAATGPEGLRLVFEPRDWDKLARFAQDEVERAGSSRAASRGALGSSTASPLATSTPAPGAASLSSPRPPHPLLAEDTVPEASRKPAPGPELGPEDESTLVSGAARPSSAPPGRGVCRTVMDSAHVLVVDDDPDIRDVVSAMLEAVGLTVAQATSAEEALGTVGLGPFDLVVLDWNLPKMTGIDLCRKLRKDAGTASLPVLFLTANASSQDMVEAFASGADDYVVKPFRAPELGARIFSLLRRARMGTP